MTIFDEDGSAKESHLTIEPDEEPILYPDQPNLLDEPTEPVRVGLWYGIYGNQC